MSREMRAEDEGKEWEVVVSEKDRDPLEIA